MNSSERKYSAYEIEALAATFALKKSRVYLLVLQPFKMIIDNQAIQRIFEKRCSRAHEEMDSLSCRVLIL